MDVEGLGATLFSLLCCFGGMIGMLNLLGAIAVNMRRLSVVVGFYRVCVIDAILEHSPADYVRRPTAPAESPALDCAT